MSAPWDREVVWVDTTEVDPPHEVTDRFYFEELVESMKEDGWDGRPLLVERAQYGYQAWTGSHRLAAAGAAGVAKIPVVVLNELGLRRSHHRRERGPLGLAYWYGYLSVGGESDRFRRLRRLDPLAAELVRAEERANELELGVIA